MYRRQSFSKQKIVDALLGLMRNKPFDEIRDYRIIKAAHVSSKTFYLYFKNRVDLINQVEDFYLKQFEDSLKKDHDSFMRSAEVSSNDGMPASSSNKKDEKVYYHHTINFCIKHADSLKLLLSKNGDIRFLLKLREVAFKEYVLIVKYKQGFQYDMSPGSNNYFVSQVFISIVLSALITWLQNPTRITQDMFVQFIDKIMNDHALMQQLNIPGLDHKPPHSASMVAEKKDRG